ncbi:phosphonoacetate hydrolase [Nocardiopsis sp. CNT-189]|uniref:phosphonoacetate hydrolase n=1 Tax=Nocardiopsis oceanisediminis TaxID=2816862 RepID=UPI003B2B2BE8
MPQPTVTVNGRDYRIPREPVVVVCIDGSEPDYHEKAIAAGRMPFLAGLREKGGTFLDAECAMPSFTNPNNLSIATGVPPSVHGICGNYFYDPDSGEEVMMNDPGLLRAPTLFAAFAEAGCSVAVATAKDKLRRLLGRGLRGRGVCFSAEKADTATLADNGIEGLLELAGMGLPEVYSAGLSEFAMAAGTEVLERDRPDLTYISLTDYIQHKHAPGTPVADDFYAMLDGYFRRIHELGAVLVVTADHGMNRKSDAGGEPNVVYAQSLLDDWYGPGSSRVVLPITDPYTAHHGALGSFATVHLAGGAAERAGEAAERLAALPGIERVLDRARACAEFDLPADRLGDLVLLARRDTAIGTAPERHDLSQLDEPLRSHGGLSEQRVPFIVNRRVTGVPQGHRLRNYDAYWVALGRVAAEAAAPAG